MRTGWLAIAVSVLMVAIAGGQEVVPLPVTTRPASAPTTKPVGSQPPGFETRVVAATQSSASRPALSVAVQAAASRPSGAVQSTSFAGERPVPGDEARRVAETLTAKPVPATQPSAATRSLHEAATRPSSEAAPSASQESDLRRQPAAASAIRAELSMARLLVNQTEPLWVRFTLTNPTDQAIDVPGPAPAGLMHEAGLPRELIFGVAASPSLHLSQADERPVALVPADPASGGAHGLTLAPHSSVSTEVNLRSHRKELRYSGRYRLEWRPLGANQASATLEFRVEQRMQAKLITDYGPVTFTLEYDRAPKNVDNFLDLVRSKFYDNTPFRRILPDVMLQGGAPGGDAMAVRPDGKLIPGELHNTPFEIGSLAMALKGSDVNSASCQFFITLGRVPELDGKYTIIGRARDENSLRILRQMASVATDKDLRPLQPLVARFFTLVPEETSQVERFEMSPTGGN